MILLSCATETPEPEVVAEGSDRLQIRALPDAEVVAGPVTSANQRLIADLLFAGLQALDADRLLTPIDDNAHARFQRVLAYDPDNEIALQGLQDIVARYLELAGEASRQGLFDEAEVLLDRARFVDDEHPAIGPAAQALSAERNSGDLFFDFDSRELARQTDAVRAQLAEVAEQAREHNAFFLITAPNDELARWMFAVMRDAVTGYRLRGNIELASRASIRLRMPQGID
ncbi:MAG: hypothetical protein MI746_04940 [Pseudomonadales bacterium]|nr:hypothetical protein [Pseudomonadales bacterium]